MEDFVEYLVIVALERPVVMPDFPVLGFDSPFFIITQVLLLIFLLGEGDCEICSFRTIVSQKLRERE